MKIHDHIDAVMEEELPCVDLALHEKFKQPIRLNGAGAVSRSGGVST